MSKRKYESRIGESAKAFVLEQHEKAKEEEAARDEGFKVTFAPKISIKSMGDNGNVSDVNPEIAALVRGAGEKRDRSGKGTRCFYMSDRLYGKLKSLAEDNGMNVSEVLTMILEKYL